MFCGNCGRQIADGARFCPYCGAQQAAPAQAQPTQPPRVAQPAPRQAGYGYSAAPGAGPTVQPVARAHSGKGVTRIIITVVCIALCVGVVFLLVHGIGSLFHGNDLESQVVGSWVDEDADRVDLTLYDDGTGKMYGEYGTISWNIVNENCLKITNVYQESYMLEDVSVKKEGGKTYMYFTMSGAYSSSSDSAYAKLVKQD